MKKQEFWMISAFIGFMALFTAIRIGISSSNNSMVNPLPLILVVIASVPWITYSIIRFMDSESMNQPLPVILRWTCTVHGNCLTWRNKFFVKHPFLFTLTNRGGGLFFVILVLVCTAGYGLIVWNLVFDRFVFRGNDFWIVIPMCLVAFGMLIALWRITLDALRHPVNHTVIVNLDKRSVYSKGIRALAGSLETELPFAEIDGVLHHSFTYKFVTTHRLYVLHGRQRLMLFNLLSDGDSAAIRGQLDQCNEPALREIAQFSNPQTQP
jgi:hypothetical protein